MRKPRQTRRRTMPDDAEDMKAIEARMNQVIDALREEIIGIDAQTNVKTCIILAGERTKPAVVHRESVRLIIEGAAVEEALREIAASPLDDGTRFPVLVLVDGIMAATWVKCRALSTGGQA